MENEDLRFTVSARDIYDKVAEIGAKVDVALTRAEDHERRLRTLEFRVFAIPGSALLIGVAMIVMEFLLS